MPTQRNLRIVLSGPTGSGKSSLAKILGDKYQLPVIREKLMPVFHADQVYRRKRREGASTEELLHARERRIRCFFTWLQNREKEYSTHAGFIADRWEADLLNIWLDFNFREPDVDQYTLRLFQTLRERAKNLDLVIVMPLQEPFSSGENEDDAALSRFLTFTSRFKMSLLTRALIQQCPGLQVYCLPNKLASLDDRVQLLDSVLGKLNRRA